MSQGKSKGTNRIAPKGYVGDGSDIFRVFGCGGLFFGFIILIILLNVPL